MAGDGARGAQGQSRIGVLGMAVMGQNLARNIAHKGFPVAVYNRTTARTEEFFAAHGHEGPITATRTLKEFVGALKRPRAAMLMVQAGRAVDAVIEELKPLLEPG